MCSKGVFFSSYRLSLGTLWTKVVFFQTDVLQEVNYKVYLCLQSLFCRYPTVNKVTEPRILLVDVFRELC
jgi:hypothetical protein